MLPKMLKNNPFINKMLFEVVKMMEEKVHPIIQEWLDSLTEDQQRNLIETFKPITEIKAPEIKIPDSAFDSLSGISETKKTVVKFLSTINLSSIIDSITKPKRGLELYHGLEIEKYRKIRKMKASNLAELLGINKASLSK